MQAWRPYRKKDIDMLERIQRRATKIIPELKDLSYEEHLKECGLTTLETRRLRGDQIEFFKKLNGYENIDRNMFVSLKKDSRTRGHEVKLVKDQCRLDIRKYSFSQRTINDWNKLSTDCVTSSMNMFKNKVDTYLRLHIDEHCWIHDKPMASLSTCQLGLWLGWQILLNLVKPRCLTGS